jgi:hypothetical protein
MDRPARSRRHEDDGIQPMNIGIQYFVNAVRPEGSAERQLRFSMSLLYPKK